MSNQYEEYSDDDDLEVEQPPRSNPSEIASLRAAADKGKKLEPKVQKLERENAFLRAGIDPEDQKLGYFYRGYDGELSPEAIRAAAQEAGFIAPPQADPAVQAHQQGQQQVMAASQGTESEYDPQGAIYALEKAMAEGGVEAMMQVGQQYGLKIARPQ